MDKFNIEELIDAALADGKLTEKERQILRNRAEKEGVDPDEFELLLESRLSKFKREEKNKEEDKPAFSKENIGKTSRKIILNLIPWLFVIFISFIESAVGHPILSLISWGVTGHNVVFWVMLLEHSIALLAIWGVVVLLKRFVFDTLSDDSKERLRQGIPLPEKGVLSFGQALKESLVLPGFGWRLAIVVSVILTVFYTIEATQLSLGVILVSLIVAIINAYIAVFILEFLYLYIINNGTTKRRVIIFSTVGIVIACVIVFNTVDGIKNSAFGIGVTEFIGRIDHDSDKMTRVTYYYLQHDNMEKALDVAGTDYANTGNDVSTQMIITHCINQKDYDLARDLAVGIEHEGYIEQIAKLYIDNDEDDKALEIAEYVFGLDEKVVKYRWKRWEAMQQYDKMIAQLQEDLHDDCKFGFTSVSESSDCNVIYNNDNQYYNQKVNRVFELALRNNQIDYATQCLSLFQPQAYMVGRTLIKKRTILSDVYHYRFETRNPDRDNAEKRLQSVIAQSSSEADTVAAENQQIQ